MKKFLLSLCLTMLAFVGVWAQATHTSYKFKAASDGTTLFMDAEGQTPASYDANDVCSGTYYLKVDYQHTTAPATTDGPSTFKVKDYYVDGVCTYGKEYNPSNEYSVVSNASDDVSSYLEDKYYFASGATNVYAWDSSTGDFATAVKVNVGDICELDVTYYINSQHEPHTGQDLLTWYNYVTKATGFKSTEKEHIYTLSDGIYTQIPTIAYDPAQAYYYVTFIAADASEVSDADNFKASKLVDLTDDSRILFHKNGTSYNEVHNGDLFFEDDAYYVAGTSYQPCTPAELAALGYATGTTRYYNCDVATDEVNKIYTVTYHLYDNSYGSYKEYIRDSNSDISNYYTLDVKCSDANESSKNTLAELFSAVKECDGILNLVIADFANYGFNSKDAIDLSNLNGSSVKRIILPDATWTDATMLSNVTNSDGAGNVYVPLVQAYNTNASTKKVEIIHSYTAGALNAIRDAHYYSTNIDGAYWIEINGNINADDMLFINGIHNDRLNLAGATNASADEAALREAMHDFTNDYVKYLAWPVFTTDPSNPLYTDLYDQCDNLVAVGQYVVPTNGNTKLVAYTKEEGKIKDITDMLAVVTNNNVNIKNVKVSGNLKAIDLYAYDQVYNKVGADGHLYFTEEVDEYATTSQSDRKNADDPNGQSVSQGAGALEAHGPLISIDLSDAVFTRYEDMTLRNLNLIGSATKIVKIPTSSLVKELPADFLNAATQIEEICIPANIEKIHARAFYGLALKHVWTTGTDPDVKYDNGATYEVTGDDESKTLESYNYGDEIPVGAKMVYGTYTFSPNLKFIGSGTFAGSTNIHDVYMLGKQAPVCCVDAFSTISYVANNSYQSSEVVDKIERDSYANSKYNWMTVLHFPAECTTNEAKLYTDVTRQYSIASDERDGRGKIVYYPTMCEWNRSFVQGSAGYLWNAHNTVRNGMSGTAMGFFKTGESGDCIVYRYVTGNTQVNYQETANETYDVNANTNKSAAVFYDTSSDGTDALAYDKTLYNADYRGWHQFVLAAYGYSDDYVYDFKDFSDNNWWTICEPFSLTAEEMKKAFGPGVDLRKLKSVTRNVGNQTITLNFDQNHLKDAADGDVVLEAGVPYMIKPNIDDRSTPDAMVLNFEKNHVNDLRFAPKTAAELTYMLTNGKYDVPAIITNNVGAFKEPTKEMAFNGQTVNVHKNLTYSMVGTFFKYYFPLYCYFLGWNPTLNNGEGGVAFYWNNRLDKANRTWNPYTAIIVPRWNNIEGFYTPQGEFETIHYNYKENDVVGTTDDLGGINIIDQDTVNSEWYTPATSSGAKKVGYALNFNFDAEDETTAIRNTTVKNDTDNKVYNLNGQLMNNGLSKGIYVTNGKKFIVK